MYKLALSALIFLSFFASASPEPGGQGMPPEVLKRIQPGDNHKILENLAGNFTYTSKFWMDAKGKPQESSGTATTNPMLGGRYFQQEVKGMAMGQPFNGRGTMGYDNVREEYQSQWIDDMSTGMMNSSGKYNPKTKTIEFVGTSADPYTGAKDAWYKTNVKIVSKNEHIIEMFMKGADGKEFKNMEMKFKRAK